MSHLGKFPGPDASEKCPVARGFLPGQLRVAADIGGTFTDVAAILDDGRILKRKVPSSPDDYGRAVVDGIVQLLREHGLAAEDVGDVLHGCTVATNAILENKGARTALVTTMGFRDVLEMRRVRVPRLYEPLYQRSPALVPRHLRLEVRERMDARGHVIEPLSIESLAAVIDTLKREQVQAIAVCFLHSYANAAHEQAVGQALQAAFPDTFLTLSSALLPEIREYERTSTTVVNALVGPPVRRYLHALSRHLEAAGLPRRVLMMQSSGGIIDSAVVADKPAQIVECGPAAGVIGAQRFGVQSGFRNLITFDMGGTTAKASLIEDGRISRTDEYEIGGGISTSSRLVKGGGYALKLPVIDISEVGAGGGSIVWLDKADAIKVGPHSAGASPGPACYPGGGSEPTVTDANVVLGILNPHALAGGAVPVDRQRAYEAIRSRIAEPLGLSVEDAAYGIHQVATTVMVRAVKAVSTQRGRDPREFDLFAFGGNGGVHAGSLAQALGMQRIVLPPAAGIFSAIGLLLSDVELLASRSFRTPMHTPDLDGIRRVFDELRVEVAQQLGVEQQTLSFHYEAGLRYVGQAFELTTPWSDVLDIHALAQAFDAEHQRTYGHGADARVRGEIVTLRVTGRMPRRETAVGTQSPGFGAATERGPRERRVYFGRDAGWLSVPLRDRADIGVTALAGPLLIEEYEGTALVPPGATVSRDARDNLVITLAQRAC